MSTSRRAIPITICRAAAPYKGDIDWAVTDGFRLRGGYGRAIRAPAVSEFVLGQFDPIQNLATITGTLSDPCDVTLPYVNGPNGAQIKALCAAQGLPAAIAPTYAKNNPQVPRRGQSGNTSLRPEQGDVFTGGAVYRPQLDSPWFQNASHFDLITHNIRLKNAIAAVPIILVVTSCFNLKTARPIPATRQVIHYCTLAQSRAGHRLLANSAAP